MTRPYITNLVNKSLQRLPTFQQQGLWFTSHSFRHGFITQLWKDSGDLQFVKSVIGPVSIFTTSRYADHLTDADKKNRINYLYNDK